MSKAYMPLAKTVEWSTPQYLFDELNKIFFFVCDLASTAENKKCALYYTKFDDSLADKYAWHAHEGTLWLNPPYGTELIDWVKKCDEEAQKGAVIVALLPARTDTRWFHSHVYEKYPVNFLKGRLKFGGCDACAPFPNMLVLFVRWGHHMFLHNKFKNFKHIRGEK